MQHKSRVMGQEAWVVVKTTVGWVLTGCCAIAIQGQGDERLLQLQTGQGRGVVTGYGKSEDGVRCLFPLKQAVSDSLCFLGHSAVKELHLCLEPLELLLHRLLRTLLDLGSCPVIEQWGLSILLCFVTTHPSTPP